jgi:hypothetical protein
MKNIIVFCLIAFGLTACNTPTKTEEKIDFTKSYETAALALTDAQLIYDVAIVGKDSLKIAIAKMKLDSAKTVYLQSKDVYTANGGVANPKYEQLLAKTNATLGKVQSDTTTLVKMAAPKQLSNVIKAPLATAVKILDSGKFTVNKKIKQVSKAAAVSEQAVKKSLTTAKQDLIKASDTTKKRIQELKKQTDVIRDIFK